MEVRILPGQPGSRSARDCGPCNPISARQLRLFCEFSVRLYTPNLHNLGAKSSIVSGLHLKYSRFLETRARDRARSALRGVGPSLAHRRSDLPMLSYAASKLRELRLPLPGRWWPVSARLSRVGRCAVLIFGQPERWRFYIRSQTR